jgi:hypothetical protein
VGTDDVFFAGQAGPWDVRVSVRQPGVIPGLADISVRVAEPGVDSVLVTARRTIDDDGETPPPDVAEPVTGETNLWSAQLWLMVRGPHEVVVTVRGDAGEGVARIPVVAAATKQLEMSRGLGLFVIGGGLFLVLGMLTIVGAASRESVLPQGEQPAPADRRRARVSMAIATVVIALLLFGGWTWVRAESEAHRALLDRPWTADATLRDIGARRTLEFAITDPLWVNRDDADWRTRNNRYRRADLIPDHGKLMHMFVVRDDGQAAFAHIHPERIDPNRFAVAFPPLPAGTYRVYADLTHEDGFSHPLTASVDAGPPPVSGIAGDTDLVADGIQAPVADPDDAWWTAPADGATVAAGVRSTLADGSLMRWLNADDPLVAGTDADLAFSVEDPAGGVVALDPYMGMQGHAMLNRDDGGVFVHLHPSGMISMAAQSKLDAASGMSGMHAGTNMAESASGMSGADGSIRFPFVVPEPGRYRIWVQSGEAIAC